MCALEPIPTPNVSELDDFARLPYGRVYDLEEEKPAAELLLGAQLAHSVIALGLPMAHNRSNTHTLGYLRTWGPK